MWNEGRTRYRVEPASHPELRAHLRCFTLSLAESFGVRVHERHGDGWARPPDAAWRSRPPLQYRPPALTEARQKRVDPRSPSPAPAARSGALAQDDPPPMPAHCRLRDEPPGTVHEKPDHEAEQAEEPERGATP